MGFQINIGSLRQGAEVVIDHFPYKIEKKGSIGLGVFLTVFASLWGGMPGYLFIKMLRDGEFETPHLFMLLFPIIGLLLFLVGLSLYMFPFFS